MAQARIVFRFLIGLTLAVITIGRMRGGHLPTVFLTPFSSWFFLSAFVFGAFGLVSAYHAIRDRRNRSAWLTDVVLAAAWIPYWQANLQRVPGCFTEIVLKTPRDQRRPAGLMACSAAAPGVAVEVFVEPVEAAPVRIVEKPHRPPATEPCRSSPE